MIKYKGLYLNRGLSPIVFSGLEFLFMSGYAPVICFIDTVLNRSLELHEHWWEQGLAHEI